MGIERSLVKRLVPSCLRGKHNFSQHTMKLAILISLFVIGLTNVNEKTRTIDYNGKAVKTTFAIPQEFYGTYAGIRDGYLTLDSDGTGTYSYDVFGFAPEDCKKDVIKIEWGFLLDEKNNIVSFQREYGKSYPILMKSTSTVSFQGCRKEVMLDFIMKYKDGSLGVSSSDDWVKK